jgi:hypothetical protein
MPEPSLTQIFGANAVQTTDTISFKKSDLGITGEGRAEQVFAAILAKAKGYLTEENQTTDPDIQITIATGFSSLVSRNSLTYREKQLTISFQKIDGELNDIIPNDY